MAWKVSVLTSILGLVFFGLGAWPLGLLCFAYLAFSLMPRSKAKVGNERMGFHPRPRLFFAAAVVSVIWPTLPKLFRIAELVPVSDSVILRSKYLPFRWCSVAELKPGAGPFPMAASAFSGTLLVFTTSGRTYSVVTCRAFGRKEAEAKLLARFRAAALPARAGAFLLPLDAREAAGLLRVKLSPLKLPSSDLPKAVSNLSGLLLVECHSGSVRKARAFEIEGQGGVSVLPVGPGELETSPLTWEVFDGIGKRIRWADPDLYSGLLDSMLATRGGPLRREARAARVCGRPPQSPLPGWR